MSSVPSSEQAGLYQLSTRRERSWLLPRNRKLRHLHGITIRNLTHELPPVGRSRGKTIDDDAIPSTLRSPTKALALREIKKLEHSRSSSDLRLTKESDTQDHKREIQRDTAQPDKPRPSISRLRRRSTMEWASASPLERQQKLEDMTAGKMADTFVSLHAEGVDDPIYVSEVAEKVMNHSFCFFDLTTWGPSITRLSELVVRVWTKSDKMREYQFLIEVVLALPALHFVGKSLDNFYHPLPSNCILFHLTDGIYTTFTNLPLEFTNTSDRTYVRSGPNRILPSSSYDALMRLSTLDDCIQDALATRNRLASELTAILECNKESFNTMRRVSEAEETLKTVESAVTTLKRRVEAISRKRREMEQSINSRRDAIDSGIDAQSKIKSQIESAEGKLRDSKEMLRHTEDDITGQRRRICEDILSIFPIDPIPGKSLSFTIRDLPLPNSEFDDTKDDVVAAALGHVAQVVYLLSLYLNVPLPYPLQPRSSVSTVSDLISMTNGPRLYPLFLKGAVRYRFEYGVFLLNKNIEILSSSLGLKLLDIRQTLPNLKYLLYVATAGKGDLPMRKVGGIKGLMRYSRSPATRPYGVERTTSEDNIELQRNNEQKVRDGPFDESDTRSLLKDVTNGSRYVGFGAGTDINGKVNGGVFTKEAERGRSGLT
ncbi:UV radiation resistance-associated gene protein [Patellaria atrata CBS 101060]|uniref:Autophagy-related protein 14 n=1 Tax=Patellaria atrata CBS 101060 TaxID=1346257 RepID=A0A9P4VK99_9PEZI|nr:UV radiation resistance-associated gene protein [Patellaria atrata CBS 101060]